MSKRMTHWIWIDRFEGRSGWIDCRLVSHHIITASGEKFSQCGKLLGKGMSRADVHRLERKS